MIKLLPILEMPQLTLKGKTAYTPDDIALKKVPASTAFDNIVFLYQ